MICTGSFIHVKYSKEQHTRAVRCFRLSLHSKQEEYLELPGIIDVDIDLSWIRATPFDLYPGCNSPSESQSDDSFPLPQGPYRDAQKEPWYLHRCPPPTESPDRSSQPTLIEAGAEIEVNTSSFARHFLSQASIRHHCLHQSVDVMISDKLSKLVAKLSTTNGFPHL